MPRKFTKVSFVKPFTFETTEEMTYPQVLKKLWQMWKSKGLVEAKEVE